MMEIIGGDGNDGNLVKVKLEIKLKVPVVSLPGSLEVMTIILRMTQ